ncbi:FMN-dependent NADH-azoreductase [Geomonas sp.]|uniref:FMN-dependent NADH-azoreductase n=1 Tax=Geomonas sp. TaxID=2651584 RepID=UPI002B487CF2|nr:NAD(P)H-dependent oxidoreductase [Geomonas sp.]HJV35214.1 NAD(P)H-dependent oxidoreductase [Geomonas sp.]
MANLLYITCNVAPYQRSRTLSLGQEFLDGYLRFNPDDEVQVLDLYRDTIQRFDLDVLNARERMERGEEWVLLSEDERRKMSRVCRLADQLGRCDKYVFVTHSLNLWFPAEFKIYIDAICASDRTYRLTPSGVQGMLSDRRRKSLHLHAGPSGAFAGEEDHSVPYLRSVLSFLGVSEQETVLLAGDDPEKGDQWEYQAARRTLFKLASRF